MNGLTKLLNKIIDLFDSDPMLCYGWICLVTGIFGVLIRGVENVLIGLFCVIIGTVFISESRHRKELSKQKLIEEIKVYDKEIESNPNCAEAYVQRGDHQRVYLKNYYNALDDYTAAIELKPDNSSFYIKRGWCKIDLKDFSGALNDYTQAIKIDSKNSSAYMTRGDYYMTQCIYTEALSDYTSAIDLEPENYHLYLKRSKCKKMLGDNAGETEDYLKAKLIMEQPDAEYEGISSLYL